MYTTVYGGGLAISVGYIALFAYCFAFMEKVPAFECLRDDEWVPCDVEEVCDGGHYKVDFTNNESIHNWVIDYELYCEEDEEKVSFLGMSFFIGFFLGYVILLRLADIYGR